MMGVVGPNIIIIVVYTTLSLKIEQDDDYLIIIYFPLAINNNFISAGKLLLVLPYPLNA